MFIHRPSLQFRSIPKIPHPSIPASDPESYRKKSSANKRCILLFLIFFSGFVGNLWIVATFKIDILF